MKDIRNNLEAKMGVVPVNTHSKSLKGMPFTILSSFVNLKLYLHGASCKTNHWTISYRVKDRKPETGFLFNLCAKHTQISVTE